MLPFHSNILKTEPRRIWIDVAGCAPTVAVGAAGEAKLDGSLDSESLYQRLAEVCRDSLNNSRDPLGP